VSLRERGENLKERAPSLGLGFWMMRWRAWGHKRSERVAKGGAPLMRGAHKTSAKLKQVAKRREGA
jgi:hypothetical protein